MSYGSTVLFYSDGVIALRLAMNHLRASKLESNSEQPAWSARQPEEDVSALFSVPPNAVGNLKGNSNARRSYFANKAHRQEVTLNPDTWLDMDFCNGYLDFNTFSLKLPGGLHFSLLKYWDGQVRLYHLRCSRPLTCRQPVTFVCRSRDGSKEYFFIVFVSQALLRRHVTR